MFPKKTPGKGGRGIATWTFEKWKGGGRKDGWLTGEPVWLETHFWFVTHPCHSFLSDGKLACPHCAKCRPLDESCYFPWVDESGKPFASLVKKYARPVIDKLRVGDGLTVGKGKVKFDAVWVKPRPAAPQWVPSEGSERSREDFERWLIVLWKAPELFEFFNMPAPDLRPINDTPGTEERQARAEEQLREWAAKRAGPPAADGMTEARDTFPNLRAYRDRRSQNGKHE